MADVLPSARLVITIITVLTISQGACAFLANPSRTVLPSYISLPAKHEIHISTDESNSYCQHDNARRKILSILASTPFVAIQSASAQVEVLDTPLQINAGQTTSSRMLCADLEEENRIAIFERVAPSVVYIDTFAEKRDVFSTNM